METVKDLLEFTNDIVFSDFKNIGIIGELNPVRNFIINRFYKTFPCDRILVNLSIVDDIIFKISNNDIEKILNDVHDLREQILYMISWEKTAKEEDLNN